ncbi:MAG TPA: carboxypeptidase-like regulatory domain-containing protein, partial [Saprospiraceae bacterium]|nr:carboxypeptidase-like regulatory domain-containing protein [Saprospiraceae bacterium]
MMKKLLIFILLAMSVPLAAQWTLSGTVSDKDGSPLIGASVFEKDNLNNGTITDIDGKFSINLSTLAESVIISYTGYDTKEIEVSQGMMPLNLVLDEASELLGEVLVIGYGSTSKKVLTDNVAKLTSKDISNIAVSNFQSTMSGKAAGVRINQTNGKVDGGINIRIRGTASISAGSEPLYVLDGMPLINVNESSNSAPMNPLLSLSPS